MIVPVYNMEVFRHDMEQVLILRTVSSSFSILHIHTQVAALYSKRIPSERIWHESNLFFISAIREYVGYSSSRFIFSSRFTFDPLLEFISTFEENVF